MNRRGFLGSLIGGVATTAAVRTWPFRVYSFPAQVETAPLAIGPFAIRFVRAFDQEQVRFFSRFDVLAGWDQVYMNEAVKDLAFVSGEQWGPPDPSFLPLSLPVAPPKLFP